MYFLRIREKSVILFVLNKEAEETADFFMNISIYA